MSEREDMLLQAAIRRVVFALYGVDPASARAGDISEDVVDALINEGIDYHDYEDF